MEEIERKLISMMKVDQGMRRARVVDEIVDRKNAEELKKIVIRIGWPTISKVGEEASHAAWLIAQHASFDQEFQEKCLTLMKAADEGQVSKKNIAYLEDRLRVKQVLPQLYGTQFYKYGLNDTFKAYAIEDESNVNKRRKEMGIKTTFEENLRIITQRHG